MRYICSYFHRTRFTSDYIQFIFIGSKESKGEVFAATKDENTVMIVKKEKNR